MKKKVRVTKEEWDQLTPELQADYVEDKTVADYPYVLDTEPVAGWQIDNPTSLRTALGREKQNAQKLADRYKKIEGLDIDELLDAHGRLDEIRNYSPDDRTKAMIEAQVKAARKSIEQERDLAVEERNKLLQQLDGELLTSRGAAALAKRTKKVKAMLPHLLSHSTVRVENGVRIPVLLDESGEPMYTTKPGQQGYMGYDEYVELMSRDPEFAQNFPDEDVEGSGAGGGRRGGRPKGGKTSVKATDFDALGGLVDKIADGEVTVEM